MSPAKLLPQVYDDGRKLAAAGMRHEAASQPRVNVHFAGELKAPQLTSVGTTAARTGGSPTLSGHIARSVQVDLCNVLRSATPSTFLNGTKAGAVACNTLTLSKRWVRSGAG
jgi:hypothetical protein